MSRGAALPLVLAATMVLIAAALAAFALARIHLALARAQTGADLAATAAAQRLALQLPRVAADGGLGQRERLRLRAAARSAAEGAGTRLRELRLPAGLEPPTAVEVVVDAAAPLGARAPARARAGLAPPPAPVASGSTAWARGGGYSGPLVYRDGRPTCPSVAAAFDVMDAAAGADGLDLVVVSGFRSDAEQAQLFRRHPDPRWVAPPGRSRHRDGTELDIGPSAAYAWLARRAPSFGFVLRYSWEPWHWGYRPGCGGSGAGGPAGTVPEWVPGPLRPLVARAAATHGIPPTLLSALLRAESNFSAAAVSPAGARGIAQLMPATARGLGVSDPHDPGQAVPAAARLLAGHLRAFGSPALALAAYNAGAEAVRRHGGIPPYRETQAYVVRVLALAGSAGAVGARPVDVVLLRAGGALV